MQKFLEKSDLTAQFPIWQNRNLLQKTGSDLGADRNVIAQVHQKIGNFEDCIRKITFANKFESKSILLAQEMIPEIQKIERNRAGFI